MPVPETDPNRGEADAAGQAARSPGAVRGIAANFALVVVSVTVLLLLLEGLASVVVFVIDRRPASPALLAERVHTRYDAELGWINVPNLYIEEMYGPRMYLRTNSSAFRNSRDFTANVPEGKIRIICSGDSFTLGYGVDNEHTWCELLGSLDGRIETVNMGQGGYGIDQAYLWYLRDGVRFDHQIHLFAFITDDFRRMQYDEFLGYGKPVLRLAGKGLATENVPVPRLLPSLRRSIFPLRHLRLFELIGRLADSSSAARREEKRLSDEEADAVALRVFETLRGMNEARGGVLVLVYLPTEEDLSSPVAASWRGFLKEESARRGILIVDLLEDFEHLPPDAARKLFIHGSPLTYAVADGHYSIEGNAFIAKRLHERLLALPDVSRVFLPASPEKLPSRIASAQLASGS